MTAKTISKTAPLLSPLDELHCITDRQAEGLLVLEDGQLLVTSGFQHYYG